MQKSDGVGQIVELLRLDPAALRAVVELARLLARPEREKK